MYHLLKGFHEYITRSVVSLMRYICSYISRKEEFSVIIIGLDGAGKTVSA